MQGLGAGAFFPAIAALIQLLYAGPARGRAFGALGAVIGLSTALGPLAGGLLIQAAGVEHGWRWVFLVNVPIGLVAVPLAAALLPRDATHRDRQRVDPVGVALLSAALIALLVPLIEGQRQGWPAWTYGCLALSVLLLVALGWWLVRLERRGGDPLIPPHLVRDRAFAAGTVLALVYFAGFTSVFFTLSILWQVGLGHSALSAGLVTLPFPAGSLITAALSDRFSARLGRTVLVIGCSMVAAGLLALLLVLRGDRSGPGRLADRAAAGRRGARQRVVHRAEHRLRALRGAAAGGRRGQRRAQHRAAGRLGDRHRGDRHDPVRHAAGGWAAGRRAAPSCTAPSWPRWPAPGWCWSRWRWCSHCRGSCGMRGSDLRVVVSTA